MARTGRGRLTWVTALTVASLLLGSGAINALAEGRDGGGGNGHGGGGKGNAEHAQTVSTAHGESGESHGNANTATTQSDEHGHAASANDKKNEGNASDDDTTTTTPTVTADADDAAKMDREDVEDDDMVTPPVRVTLEDRPGLGCGDENHHHTGAPGNDDVSCKKSDDDSDASTATTATATDMDDTADVESAGD